VSSDVLDARSTWADPVAYDAQAAKLARMFIDNFKTSDLPLVRPARLCRDEV
jgi:ATP-dependent phosphoenolpyruvate carboxykinase